MQAFGFAPSAVDAFVDDDGSVHEGTIEAIAEIGEQKYRIWIAYLAGVSLAFSRGTLRIFQTLVSKSPKRAPPLPPTRADLYR